MDRHLRQRCVRQLFGHFHREWNCDYLYRTFCSPKSGYRNHYRDLYYRHDEDGLGGRRHQLHLQ
jgi:hypothetical protein